MSQWDSLMCVAAAVSLAHAFGWVSVHPQITFNWTITQTQNTSPQEANKAANKHLVFSIKTKKSFT